MLRVTTALVALAVLMPSLPAAAGDASTTRIESRPFYGATVTLEEGVRVFRALPANKHVIINPDNKTALNLSFNEDRSASAAAAAAGSGDEGGQAAVGRLGSALANGAIGTGPAAQGKRSTALGTFPGGIRHKVVRPPRTAH